MFTQSQSYNWPFEGHGNADVALGENESDCPKLLRLRIHFVCLY